MSDKEKNTEKALGEEIVYLDLLMTIWESDGLMGNDESRSSDGNSSQRPTLAPEAKLRAHNFLSMYF